jgi:hypothetical protein
MEPKLIVVFTEELSRKGFSYSLVAEWLTIVLNNQHVTKCFTAWHTGLKSAGGNMRLE